MTAWLAWLVELLPYVAVYVGVCWLVVFMVWAVWQFCNSRYDR